MKHIFLYSRRATRSRTCLATRRPGAVLSFVAALTKRLVLIALLLTQLSGCDSAIDCLDADGPQFDNKTLPDATLNQVYTGLIRVSINNEPQDDRFSYQFKLSGQLPAGLQSTSAGRDLVIEGTATELGTYSFRVFVEVVDDFDGQTSGLCYTSRSRDFQLTVVQGN